MGSEVMRYTLDPARAVCTYVLHSHRASTLVQQTRRFGRPSAAHTRPYTRSEGEGDIGIPIAHPNTRSVQRAARNVQCAADANRPGGLIARTRLDELELLMGEDAAIVTNPSLFLVSIPPRVDSGDRQRRKKRIPWCSTPIAPFPHPVPSLSCVYCCHLICPLLLSLPPSMLAAVLYTSRRQMKPCEDGVSEGSISPLGGRAVCSGIRASLMVPLSGFAPDSTALHDCGRARYF
ncbi:hypothetical protein K431DRAFT_146835 [Polychaeton citri CBS 116435]|uniref:Uncharacterized protein n=1 Tax=Polychaeton citri CBS 116435 TaxID=1314669 RepID=A0A9P4QGP0_9PEZI|nr:hypothetical protein K431DRAFT_146835 [Polychaeton citri CBS 116435]